MDLWELVSAIQLLIKVSRVMMRDLLMQCGDRNILRVVLRSDILLHMNISSPIVLFYFSFSYVCAFLNGVGISGSTVSPAQSSKVVVFNILISISRPFLCGPALPSPRYEG